MARIIHAKSVNKNQDGFNVTKYRVDIPDDVLFFERNGVIYAQWWESPGKLMEIPVSEIISIA